ncbi:hypothetical protein FOMPIDRAFT_1036126 [Fomitopsis schrenkii]|uniref:Uncharacterized protein n=1 Tax=Fomitopsis schrenkii TaxID=2126942 RepID=S8FJN9_FOMSC|nr:hypothetical protein FOMPIDRAFT_1036126 [Fomitopsis schrenkii]
MSMHPGIRWSSEGAFGKIWPPRWRDSSLSLKASTGNLSMSSSVPSTPSTASPSASFTQSNSTLASLRGLYPRAARAFLQRNVALTHSLLTAAFALIEPPPQPAYPHGASSGVDALASQRRKWEILRVTFETTLYAAPPATEDPDELPAPLRANLLLSPEPFIATLHNRSLQLFMPASAGKPNSSCLPAQVLVTLALAGLKLGCTAVARAMIEDWLARRPQYAEAGKEEREGYAKVLELYCLHVLPRLEDWDYAEDFLQYERELAPDARKYILSSLHSLRAQAMSSQSSTKAIMPSASGPALSTVRSSSPARSESSVSSSSSGSTHTATPTTPRPNGKGKAALHPVSPMTAIPASASSHSISSAATSRTVTPSNAHAHIAAPRHRSRSRSRTKADRRSTPAPLPQPPRAAPVETPAPSPPSTLALLRTSCAALTRGVSRAKFLAYVLVFVVVPLLSFVLRVRRTRAAKGGGAGQRGAVEEVRRRLKGGGEGKGVVARVWEELVRAVGDTVQMGGRGLV